MKYHIFLDDETRFTIDDEQEHTDGECVTLQDGQILHGNGSGEYERLDVEGMDASFKEFLGNHDLDDPNQRAHLKRTFEETKATAEAKIEDHQAMFDLATKYLGILDTHDKKPNKRRHLR